MLLLPILIMIGWFGLSKAAHAQYWVSDPATCPQTYSGQNCTPDLVCGVNGSTAQCYDTSLLTPPVGDTTSNTDESASYNGGYILNCYAYDTVLPVYCDNSGAWWCDRNSACYNVNRDTTCIGGKPRLPPAERAERIIYNATVLIRTPTAARLIIMPVVRIPARTAMC